MTQGNILEQAKQGNPDAIAALMSRSMKSQGIDVRASLEGSCLQVRLEAQKVPSPQATIAFVRKGLTNLGVERIESVDIESYQPGASAPTWREQIFLQEPIAPPLSPLPDEVETQWGSEEIAMDDEFGDESLVGETPLMQELSSIGDEEVIPQESIDNEDYGSQLPDELSGFASIAEFPEDEYSGTDNDEENALEEEREESMMDEEQKPKTSPLALLLLLLAALGLGGFYLYTQKPELLAGVPILKDYLPVTSPTYDDPMATAPVGETVPEAAPATAPAADTQATPVPAPEAETPVAQTEAPEAAPAATEAPTATEAPAPTQTATADPFRDAVNKANSASAMIQTASTPAEWSQIAADWEAAVSLMQTVPESHPQYAIAQDRIPKYRRYLEYAQQQAQ